MIGAREAPGLDVVTPGATTTGHGATGDAAVELGQARDVEVQGDAWLVSHARCGDLQAFEVLAGRHQDRIFRVALRMLGDREEAEDVAQDVLLQLWCGLAAFSGSSAFTTWLHRVVVNRCLSRLDRRRSAAQLPEAGEPGHPSTRGTGEQVQDRRELAIAAAAVAALPVEQRSVFVLCQLEGLSYRQAAAVERVSEASVRGRLARARAGVGEAMKEWA